MSGVASEKGTGNVAMSAILECPYFGIPIVPVQMDPELDVTQEKVIQQAQNEVDPLVDIQMPIVLRDPNSNASHVFFNLADELVRQVLKREIMALQIPAVTYVKSKGLILRYVNVRVYFWWWFVV